MKKNGHLRFFHQLVEGISLIIFQQKWKSFIEGFSRKIAKSKMAAIFTTPCIENLDWKDKLLKYFKYLNLIWKTLPLLMRLIKNCKLFMNSNCKILIVLITWLITKLIGYMSISYNWGCVASWDLFLHSRTCSWTHTCLVPNVQLGEESLNPIF